jgi:hypothetical protein
MSNLAASRGDGGKGKARIQTEQKDNPFVDLMWALFDSVGIVGADLRRPGGQNPV